MESVYILIEKISRDKAPRRRPGFQPPRGLAASAAIQRLSRGSRRVCFAVTSIISQEPCNPAAAAENTSDVNELICPPYNSIESQKSSVCRETTREDTGETAGARDRQPSAVASLQIRDGRPTKFSCHTQDSKKRHVAVKSQRLCINSKRGRAFLPSYTRPAQK